MTVTCSTDIEMIILYIQYISRHIFIYLICDDDENDDDVFVVVCMLKTKMYKLMENERRQVIFSVTTPLNGVKYFYL